MFVNERAKIRRTFRKIHCWKVVEWDSLRCRWTGPYYDVDSYVEGKMLKSDERIKVEHEMVRHGLHTYADESDARKFLEFMTMNVSGRFLLVQCEIPRFCRYIENGEDGEHCYVSEKLKVVKFV